MHSFDLEERTYVFARDVRRFIRLSSKNIFESSDYVQLVKSSGSVGANYIEANDSLSKKDFVMRMKICLKEIKETIYWLKLISDNNQLLEDKINALIIEAMELKKIFASILINSK